MCLVHVWGLPQMKKIGLCILNTKKFIFLLCSSHWRDERKSRHVTNCTVGITGLERANEEGECGKTKDSNVCPSVWIFMCVSRSCTWRCTASPSWMFMWRWEGHGSAAALWGTEMANAYQNETPASHCSTSCLQSVPSAICTIDLPGTR